eukprot:scaffold472640_cov47-Prasinocladus_malaysianus.AAC.1
MFVLVLYSHSYLASSLRARKVRTGTSTRTSSVHRYTLNEAGHLALHPQGRRPTSPGHHIKLQESHYYQELLVAQIPEATKCRPKPRPELGQTADYGYHARIRGRIRGSL